MATSKEKSALYSEKLLPGIEATDLEYGPKHLPEEPNIWSQKGRFVLLLWTYIMQGTIHAVNSATKKAITFETEHCEDPRQIDDLLETTKCVVLLKIVVAPLVDYFKPFCCTSLHRRFWLIICQMFSSLFLFLLAWNWDNIVFQAEEEKCPDGELLIGLLMPMLFFTAVGDIALDGLAVVALLGPNIAYAGVAGSFGPRFGRKTLEPILIGASKDGATGYQAALYTIAAVNFITCAVVLRIPEISTKSDPRSGLCGAYKKMFRMLCNKRTLALCFICATWHMGLGNVIGSGRDERHRGWTKDDLQSQGFATMLPNLVFFYAVSVYAAKLNPIGKMPLGLAMFLVGSLLEFATWFFVPYLKREKSAGYDQSCLSSWLSASSNGCEPWVFPFRVGLDIGAMPFEYMFEQILGAQTSRMTPPAFAGTFTSLLHTAQEVGETIASNLENDFRITLDRDLRKFRCTGSLEMFGRDTFMENNETYRYCGHKDACRIDPPVDGETGFCNPYADGYNVLVIIALALFLLWGAVLYFTLAKYVNVEKEKYDPNNDEEMIRCPTRSCCVCCQRRSSAQIEGKGGIDITSATTHVSLLTDTDTTDADSYVAIEDL